MQNIMQRFGVALIGILFIAVGAFLFVRNNDLVKKCTEETEATVIGMDQELSTDSDNNNTYMFYPILEYKVDGEIVQSKMIDGSNTPDYKLGDKITILFNPKKTSEFIIKGDISSSIMSYVFMGIGAIATIGGAIVALKKES